MEPQEGSFSSIRDKGMLGRHMSQPRTVNSVTGVLDPHTSALLTHGEGAQDMVAFIDVSRSVRIGRTWLYPHG